ncbi:hypothetical protein [Saccharomonospora glauca]|uniref:Uncharacterized protein n=1 Tax=Saccharomonospora glauca K62 TaxID=928724 RepID=I1D0N1_9PSEU|nr:hypothetical protein [Saccharomonospora glauca]EIE98505.1 hypothetical protein SacglDRAFT_01590 [Saccharomonospora glauca K62]
MTRSTTTGENASKPRRRLSRKRAAIWAGSTLACYATTLCLLSDVLFPLAIPGIIGLLVIAILGVIRFLHARPRPYEVRDVRHALRRHRLVVWRRFGGLLVLAVALCALPPLLDVTALYPLLAVGVVLPECGLAFFGQQLWLLRRCSKVLSVYEPRPHVPITILSGLKYGQVSLRLGEESRRLPRMAAQGVAHFDIHDSDIAGEGWYAGDDELGGVLVPATGDLLLLVPLDGKERARHRSRADSERKAKERRAGLDRVRPKSARSW